MEREDIISDVNCLAFDEGFMEAIQYTFYNAVSEWDVELTAALIRIGANPNDNPYFQYAGRNYGFLHQLVNDYVANRTLHGQKIIQVIELLLSAGADPNQAGDSNMAPIQRCTSKKLKPIKDLLIKFGANKKGNPIY